MLCNVPLHSVVMEWDLHVDFRYNSIQRMFVTMKFTTSLRTRQLGLAYVDVGWIAPETLNWSRYKSPFGGSFRRSGCQAVCT
jgi:hypothetical protein